MADIKDLPAHVLSLGDIVPNFDADTTEGKINFHEWIGNSWAVLFSHPRDFTPVCTTEIGTMQKYLPEFQKRGVKPIVLSIDNVEDHKRWCQDIIETQGVAEVTVPVIGDKDRKVAVLYNMLDKTNLNADGLPVTVRSVFIIDPSKKLRLSITYPASTGRNFKEIIRVIDSLQLTDRNKVATPADWEKGKDVVILPFIPKEQADQLFPGYKTLKPYLRLTPDPSIAADAAAAAAAQQ